MDKENTKSQITENLAHVDYESGRCISSKFNIFILYLKMYKKQNQKV